MNMLEDKHLIAGMIASQLCKNLDPRDSRDDDLNFIARTSVRLAEKILVACKTP